ncbi:hypothetical protein ACHAXA_002042 [Cyclostephanos tholiformis]|uniref:FCP1 homology domain-containing protein n=1 Tax=Cyclostephanos tholiformis TaxID=382380 RepID=A0ABD3ST70_9STRA
MDDTKPSASMAASSPWSRKRTPVVTMIAKYGKQKFELTCLPSMSTNVGHVKEMLHEKTGILPKRQKLIGLKKDVDSSLSSVVDDDTMLSDLKVKGATSAESSAVVVHQFILMGTPEDQIFVDPSEKADLPSIIDDFDLDFNAGSEEWIQHKAKEDNLQKFTESTEVHIINPPQTTANNAHKPLLVLDLDHTLLDFSSRTLTENGATALEIGSSGDTVANQLKRPYMDEFLTWSYKYYNLVVWSQTSWRWLEVKLTELGMLTHSGYKICFVLDKTSMFQIVSTNRSGKDVTHYVKPLQIIWSKFPQWNSHNTVHLDDLARNFALNLGSGLKCTAYYRRKKGRKDAELLGLGRFLELLATNEEVKDNFEHVDFQFWQDYISGKRNFQKKK